MAQDKDLQKLIDQYVYSESGAEIIYNAQTLLGALAGFVYDPLKKTVAYQLLGPLDAMAYDSIHGFHVHDWVHQKEKDKDRLVLRDDDGQIYVIRPAQSHSALETLAFYPLSEENSEHLRAVLTAYVRTT